jgi:hypothetical protein
LGYNVVDRHARPGAVSVPLRALTYSLTASGAFFLLLRGVTIMIDLLLNAVSAAFELVAGVDADSSPGFGIHGGPDDANIVGNRPSDIQGTPLGNDNYGRPNNRGIHG